MVGMPQSVLETGCIGVAKPAEDCAGEYDVLKLEDGMLYFGERSVDLCETRAPAVNPYPLFYVPEFVPVDINATAVASIWAPVELLRKRSTRILEGR